MSEVNTEDYLRKHLEKLDTAKKISSEPIQQQKDNSRTVDLQYQSFDAALFPCGIFYPTGTTIQIRAALVKEIQAYSMVDDINFQDIIDKMNDMLMACVRIKYPNGDIGSYLEIKDQDRLYILFLIRKITFQQGMHLTVNKQCTCKNDVQIELMTSNFLFFKSNEKLEKFFDSYNRCYVFEFEGQEFRISRPNIGLEQCFSKYITDEVAQKKEPNMAFLKIMPYLLGDRTTIEPAEIKKQLNIFQSMSIESFQFVNSAISHMKFGIEHLKKNCSACSQEVITDMVFPNGASGIFVVHDIFDRFIEK